MTPRRALVLVCLAALGLGAVGCSPSPAEPSPKRTAAFDSEEAAFAAAEETYRAYVDALNKVDFRDPETFEPVFALSSGDLEANDRETFSEYHAHGYVFVGETKLAAFKGQRADPPYTEVAALVCMDVSGTDIVGEDGASLLSPTRAPTTVLDVTFEWDDRGRYLVSRSQRTEGEKCDD